MLRAPWWIVTALLRERQWIKAFRLYASGDDPLWFFWKFKIFSSRVIRLSVRILDLPCTVKRLSPVVQGATFLWSAAEIVRNFSNVAVLPNNQDQFAASDTFKKEI
jgi:hypothetical protein